MNTEDRAHFPGRREYVNERVLGDESTTGRRILQFVGTEMFRTMVHPEIWVMAMERRMKNLDTAKLVAITDIRFNNEAAFVHRRGGVVVHVSRPGLPEIAGHHASENGLDPSFINHHLIVGEGMAAAEHHAAQLYESLQR